MANVMKKVAEALGLQLGEEFSLGDEARYVLMEDGFFEKIGEKTYYQLDIDNLLNGNWDVVKLPKQILDEKEKEYLSNVIEPYRNKNMVECICKYRVSDSKERLTIYIKNDVGIDLPKFEKGTMYKGMELKKDYTLEELGL